MTAAVFTLQLVLLSWALWRRPDYATLALALAYCLGVLVAGYWPPDSRLPVIVALDAAVVAVMRHLAFRFDSDRARIVATIGGCKIAFAFLAVWIGTHPHTRAAAINTAFIAQVIIAGGLGNGVLAWLGHRVDGLGRRFRRNFGTVGA